jgi:imidazolonepropionase-like amidohydrolase
VKTLIEGGRIVTGDGSTDRPGNLWLDGDRITAVDWDDTPAEPDVGVRIDARGSVVMPGVINNHAHGCSYGPLFPSAAPALPRDKVRANLDRHLMQGETTTLNVCGLTTPDEVAAAADGHPLRVAASTGHFAPTVAAAQAVDGAGLSEKHIAMTAEAAVAAGAVAIGEIGSGHTLGGGGQDYKYIPERVKQATGIDIGVDIARGLKLTVLAGRYGGVEGEDLETVMERGGLTGVISVDELRTLISDTVMPPIAHALDEFPLATKFAAESGLPVMFHSSSVSRDALLAVAREYAGKATLVAGHANHNTYTVDDSVATARQLRELGVVLDVSTLDGVLTRWRNDMDRTEALASEGLIDTISTDYANGHWDSILEGIHYLVSHKFCALAGAVAMATGNVARNYQALAGDRGLLQAGKLADVVIADAVNPGRVQTVLIGGEVVVRSGWPQWSRAA